MDSQRFERFNITKTSYKKVNDQDIDVYILIPKNATKGKHPVSVHFHGGYLITGSALYADWIGQWTIDYLLTHNSILIAPNHRLLPESTGADILSDLSDFWTWVSHSLITYVNQVQPGIVPDLSHTLIYGVSAGGYLGVQSALSQIELYNGQKSSQKRNQDLNIETEVNIRALIASYPMLDIASSYYTAAYTKSIFGAPTLAPDVLDVHLATMSPGTIVTAAEPPARLNLALAMVQQGRYEEFLGRGGALYPFERIAQMSKVSEVEEIEGGEKGEGQFPYVFILHGEKDTAVPVEGSRRFKELMDGTGLGRGRVELCVQEGGEHGFDAGLGLEESWLSEGLERVRDAWLGGDV